MKRRIKNKSYDNIDNKKTALSIMISPGIKLKDP